MKIADWNIVVSYKQRHGFGAPEKSQLDPGPHFPDWHDEPHDSRRPDSVGNVVGTGSCRHASSAERPVPATTSISTASCGRSSFFTQPYDDAAINAQDTAAVAFTLDVKESQWSESADRVPVGFNCNSLAISATRG